ncbi:MAG: 4Fe-4S binding protein, partial [Oscillospiraceae bacterium]|nr:4Fe-4S binding protein [Oscillospiraceae bacterium]
VAWFEIEKDKCIGCTKCARNCPVGAIKGTIKQPHEIDQNVCIKCGACARGCPKKAVKENNPWLKNT